MTELKTRNTSYGISILFHLALLVLLFYMKLEVEYPVKEYIEVGFGGISNGSSGASGDNVLSTIDEKKVEELKEKIKEDVEVPKVKNTFENEVPAVTKKKSKEKIVEPKGNKGLGTGNSGFDIEWGGNGKRKIYSYTLPEYPEGVNKEIDIRLRFSILPDGTVGTIFPLTKADTKLENAAINSLRQWRFEPLPLQQKKTEQFAIIVFPYRLQ
ncbi:MAG: energy transducer TonB [Ignavibacteriaceae bacterium]|jgi:protein TonB|nr:energy transducer TonB [Ignavibacteriaceae bacterium]